MKNNMKALFLNLLRPLSWTIKILSILIVTFFIILYLITQPLNEEIDSFSDEELMKDLSKEEFLTQLTPYAYKVSLSHGVRPSLLVAQAALESNWGNSELAKESNNYFGVKTPMGKEYQTKEFTQSEWTEINTSFKQYDSVYDSVLDYADLLRNGTSWDRNLYRGVIEASTYKEAAYALTKAGYATDPGYAEKIIEIIEYHGLNDLDNL